MTSDNVMIRENMRVRASTMDDADAVAELVNAAAVAETGRPDTTAELLLMEWNSPAMNLAADTRLVFAPDGRLVGYVEVWDEAPPYVRPYVWGCVHPDHTRQGIGSFLLEWGEARARQNLQKAPPDARVAVQSSTISTNRAAHELFEARGYRLVRHFWRMVIDMDPAVPPPAPVWPEGIRVRLWRLGQEDRAVFEAVDASFRDHWGYLPDPFEDWLYWMTQGPYDDPELRFLAVTDTPEGEEIVGVSLCRAQRVEDPEMGWLSTLAVRRPWRRQGIALALLRHTFREFHRRGKYRVGLGVDAANLTGATRLYEKAGMHVSRQWDAYEKELRPGRELSTQTLES